MKKIFALMAVASLGVAAQAQTVQELETQLADVQHKLDNYDDGIAKKWELRFDVGYETSLGEGNYGPTHKEQGGEFEIGAGYNFTSNWYLGLASGFFYRTGRSTSIDAPNYVPVLADLTWRWNLGSNEKWSIFAEARGGYLFACNDNFEFANGKQYDYKNTLYCDIQPGVYYRLRRNIDIKLSVGYAYFKTGNDEDVYNGVHNTNAFVAKLGMNFRGTPKTATRSELTAEAASIAAALEAARLAEEQARQDSIKAAQEAAAKKAAEEEAARKAAELEAARLAALEADKHKNLTLFYEIRESDLLADHVAKLDELVEWVNTRKIDLIVVKGYADKNTGNYRLNQMYAKNRAEKVKKALIKKYGIDKNMIECSSYGDTVQPFEENDKNRCTIILVNETGKL